MTADVHLEFRVLGPLEACAGGRSIPLGGGKQRAVLSLLLLRAGELVTIEHLVEGLWGEEPPASAAHTIEGYVSRLRRVLEPDGATVVRRGGGYVLELGGGAVDAHEAGRLASEAATALDEQQHGAAARLAAQALRLWRGPVLADVPLHGRGRVEADRLEELRLRMLETWGEAELALGRPEQVVAELRPLIASHPYRERLVAQLMVALCRCGRHVEALEQYERLRRTLDEELGLRPGSELQRLSAQIVRQDERLRDSTAVAGPVPPVGPKRPRRRLPLVAAAIVLAAAAATSLALVTGAAKSPAPPVPLRVGVVLPQDPAATPRDAVLTSIVDGLHRAEREYGANVEILVADEFDRNAPSVERVLERLRSGSFGLVLVFGGFGDVLAPLANASPSTRFAFFDRGPELPNATTFVFDDADAGYLAGYLSGLVEASDAARLNKRHVVSMIGGMRGSRAVEALLEGFAEGVRRALPDATVLRDYSQEFEDTSRCEAIANRQIDAGADLVFAAAGRCSLGALSSAAIRRVWAVGVDADQSYLGDHVLVSTVKRYDQAAFHAIRSFAQGTLRGGTVRLGLRDEAVGIAGIGPTVAEPIRRRVARLAWDIKRRDRR
jgi:basic membrane lipoprotein Med (substrate-binding protein (PBP1-ABC) superfamily)/DNA-binding SARP family transcriptional activator